MSELVYVLIVSPDDGATWHYADVRPTQEAGGARLRELQVAHPELRYQMKVAARDLFDALFMRGTE